ncbi:MAG: hypothetical protein GX600_08025 [Dehalococcoidia bacterium]|nr:hypothetical protein [Dehalococcoidia bacterium]
MSERLEDLFDRYVDHLIAGEDVSPDEVDEADMAGMLAPLLRTSTLVARQLHTVEPAPQFRTAARIRMRNLFFARLARRDSRPSVLALWWQQRWASAMATAMVVCLASLGVLAASFNALPSGFFYPVKVTTEQVRLSLTTSEYERAQLRLEYAERRLAEMSSMADRGDAETAVLLAGEATRLIVQTASSTAFGLTDLASGPAALVSADASTGVAPVAALSADREEAMGVLQAALEAAPEELKPDVQRLMSELTREFDATIAHLEDTTER